MLDGKEKHLLLNTINANDEIAVVIGVESFKTGFRLGVRMICDSLLFKGVVVYLEILIKENFKMKFYKRIVILVLVLVSIALMVNAADIPLESVPFNATDESIAFTESLTRNILAEVQNGLGYADARNRANDRIFSAVITNQSKGYGYGLLSPIASNAIYSIEKCIFDWSITLKRKSI